MGCILTLPLVKEEKSDSNAMKIVVSAGLIFAWIALVCIIFLVEAKLSRPNVVPGDTLSLMNYLSNSFNDAVENKTLGCGGYALIRNSRIMTEKGFGFSNAELKAPVKVDSTLFLLSSLSKAVTSWGVLKLVAQQKIGLDEPIYPHLKRWNFSSDDTLARLVTGRHLLSHTAGIVDGYGHSGVEAKQRLQTIEQSLLHPNDVNSGEGHGIRVAYVPGSAFSYSSAGYAVLQLLIEEKTGMPFHKFMHEQILTPLGLSQSRFRLEDIENENRMRYLASQYDLNLVPHPHRYYSNHAGVSLRSSIHELAALAVAYSTPNEILPENLIKEFYTPQPGTGHSWGLGHTLYLKSENGKYLFGHGGGSFPASGADLRINPSSGNAIVLVATGSQNFISPLADDWMYWETGQKDFDVRNVIRKRGVIAGVLIIGGIIGILVWGRNRGIRIKKSMRAKV